MRKQDFDVLLNVRTDVYINATNLTNGIPDTDAHFYWIRKSFQRVETGNPNTQEPSSHNKKLAQISCLASFRR